MPEGGKNGDGGGGRFSGGNGGAGRLTDVRVKAGRLCKHQIRGSNRQAAGI